MSIEFLSGEQPEEQLDLPRRSRWPGVCLLAVLIAAGSVWALARPHHAPTSPHAAPTVSKPADPACRPGCSVSAGVPHPIVLLAHSYLPPGVHLRVRTVVANNAVTGDHRLIARDIDAQVDSVTVLVRVRRGGPTTQAIAPDPLGVGSLLLHQLNSGYVVRLQYLAPETVPPMLARLRALIRDPRLISS